MHPTSVLSTQEPKALDRTPDLPGDLTIERTPQAPAAGVGAKT